jgi:hypothetical protein
MSPLGAARPSGRSSRLTSALSYSSDGRPLITEESMYVLSGTKLLQTGVGFQALSEVLFSDYVLYIKSDCMFIHTK